MDKDREPDQALFICLKSGEQVLGNCGPAFLVPGGRAMWWCCTTCKVWHVAIKNEGVEGEIYESNQSHKIVPACYSH